MSTTPKFAPRFTPTFSPDMPQEVATNFRQIYLALGDHNDAITVVHSMVTAPTTTTVVTTVAPTPTGVIPGNTPAVASEWINSYDSSNGAFTQTQPAYSDISGTPTLPVTKTPVTGEYLTGYDSTTGAFSQSTPAGISVTITTAPLTLGGTSGTMTFTGGLLTAQTPAT